MPPKSLRVPDLGTGIRPPLLGIRPPYVTFNQLDSKDFSNFVQR